MYNYSSINDAVETKSRKINQVTQLFYQPLHFYKFIKFKPKTLKTLRHISVLWPSSGSYSYIVLAKVTLIKVTSFHYSSWFCGSMPCCVVLYCQEYPVMDVRSVFRGVMSDHATKHRTHIHKRALLAIQHNTACCHKTNWNSEINMNFNCKL